LWLWNCLRQLQNQSVLGVQPKQGGGVVDAVRVADVETAAGNRHGHVNCARAGAADQGFVEKTGEIRTKMAKLRMEQLLLLKESLTEEQLKKMKKMLYRQRRRPREGQQNPGQEGRSRRKQGHGHGAEQQPAPEHEAD